jgi:hypothetical protein
MKPSLVCKHLRTKKMFIPAQADEVFEQQNGAFTDSSHCWCNRTLSEAGPDDKRAGVQACSASRPCFQE